MCNLYEGRTDRRIRLLEERVKKLEGATEPPRCPMCDIPLESLFNDGDVSGIVCSRADCCRKPRGTGTAI